MNITQAIGWRYVFYASASVAALAIPISLFALQESPKNTKIKTDWLGAIFFAGVLGSALVALTAYSNGSSAINMYIQDIYIPALPLLHLSQSRRLHS